MHEVIPDSVIRSVRVLCEKNDTVKRIFNHLSTLPMNVASLKAESIESSYNLSRTEAIDTIKKLGSTKCGTYKMGRRHKSTRLDWLYSSKYLSSEALKVSSQPTNVPNEIGEEPLAAVQVLTIDETKKILAASLGLSPDQIEIQIKA